MVREEVTIEHARRDRDEDRRHGQRRCDEQSRARTGEEASAAASAAAVVVVVVVGAAGRAASVAAAPAVAARLGTGRDDHFLR